MPETESTFDPPSWATRGVLASTLLALTSLFVGGPVTAPLTWTFSLSALLGVVYLLYLWGQHRGPPSGDGDDGRTREKEMEAEAGGYGGSGGGS